jgi:hypothetical protein
LYRAPPCAGSHLAGGIFANRLSHSERSATAGSTAMARRAGTQLAISATKISSRETPPKVSGSVGLVWYRMRGAQPRERPGARQPGGCSDSRQKQRLPHHLPENGAFWRAQGHADADLVRAPAYAVERRFPTWQPMCRYALAPALSFVRIAFAIRIYDRNGDCLDERRFWGELAGRGSRELSHPRPASRSGNWAEPTCACRTQVAP